MNRLDPDLEQLGDALRASVTLDLARETTGEKGSYRGHERGAVTGRLSRLRRRVLAGSTLGIAGVGAGLVLALGGGVAASPAFAVANQNDGSVLVTINQQESVPQAAAKLANLYGENVEVNFQPGVAPTSGPVLCSTAAGVTGPAVKVLLATNGTQVIASGNTGAGTWHVAGCQTWAPGTPAPPVNQADLLHASPAPAPGNSVAAGNSGNTGGAAAASGSGGVAHVVTTQLSPSGASGNSGNSGSAGTTGNS